jgi:hypothetical protein
MSDVTPVNLDYFDTDQVKFAVHLWKANKKAGGTDFDVLKFAQQWAYAEAVIQQTLLSDDAAVSRLALELMQLRLRFVARYPARALRLGAVIDVASAAKSDRQPDPGGPKRAYVKGVR